MNLISKEYRTLNERLHVSSPGFGGSGHKWAARVIELAAEVGARTVLDYGCGKCTLRKEVFKRGVWLHIDEYDPGIPALSAMPRPADLVVCTDVLEHVEPECLDDVVTHLLSLATRALLIAVACRPGKRPMEDGSMEHRIVQPRDWWALRLARYAEFTEVEALREREYAVVLKR